MFCKLEKKSMYISLEYKVDIYSHGCLHFYTNKSQSSIYVALTKYAHVKDEQKDSFTLLLKRM